MRGDILWYRHAGVDRHGEETWSDPELVRRVLTFPRRVTFQVTHTQETELGSVIDGLVAHWPLNRDLPSSQDKIEVDVDVVRTAEGRRGVPGSGRGEYEVDGEVGEYTWSDFRPALHEVNLVRRRG